MLVSQPLKLSGTFANSGVFDLNGQNWTMTKMGANFSNVNGTVELFGSETITGLTQDTANGTWIYVGNGSGSPTTYTIEHFVRIDYNNLIIDSTTASDTYQLGHSLSVHGTFTIDLGTFRRQPFVVTVTGLTTLVGGTYTTAGSAQNLTGGLTVAGGLFNGTTGSVTTSNVTLTGGTLAEPSGGISLAGSWSVTGGTFLPGTATVTFTATTGTQTLDSDGQAFYNLAHSGSGGNLELINNPLTLNGTFTDNAGTFNANGLNVTTNQLQEKGGTFLASTGLVTIKGLVVSAGTFTGSSGTLAVSTVTQSGGTLIAPSGPFTVSGSWAKTGGTFTAGSGVVTFTLASGIQTLNSGGSAFSGITHSGMGILQLAGNLVAAGTITNSAGIFDLNGHNLTMTQSGANFINPATVRLMGSEAITGVTQDTTEGTWIYVGPNTGTADTFTIRDFGAVDYFNLTIASTDGVDTFQSGSVTSIAGAFKIQSGAFSSNGEPVSVTGLTTISGGSYTALVGPQSLNGGLTISAGAFTGGTGTVTTTNVIVLSGTLTAPSGLMNVSGNWTITAGTFVAGTGTVAFNGTSGVQSVTSGGQAFFNFNHDAASTLQLLSTLTTGGTLVNSAGSLKTGTFTVTATGLATFSGGTVQLSTGTCNFNGGMVVSGSAFAGSTGALNTTSVTLTGGTITAPSGAFDVSGNWVRSAGTFTPGKNTVTFTSTTMQTLGSGGQAFGNIVHSGTGTLQLVSNGLTLGGTFANSAGIFDLNGLFWSFSTTGANFQNAGTIRLRGSEAITNLTQDTAEGTWIYVGNGGSTTYSLRDFGSLDYFNLIIDSTSGNDVFQATAPLAIVGTLTIESGTYNANTKTTTVTGLTTVSGGTYLGSTGMQTLTGGLTVAGGTVTASTGSITTSNFTLSSGNVTLTSGNITVSGNWSETGGTFSIGTSTVFFTAASGVQTFDTGGSSFAKVTHSGAGTLELVNNALTMSGILTNSAGIFSLNGENLTLTSTGKNFVNPANFELMGNETITGLTPDTTEGVWTYVGDPFASPGTTSVLSFGTNSYFNLNIAGSDPGDVFMAAGPIGVLGSLTVSLGTYNANGQTTTVAGATSIPSGFASYLASTATQTLNGGLSLGQGTFTGSTGNVATSNVSIFGADGSLGSIHCVRQLELHGRHVHSGLQHSDFYRFRHAGCGPGWLALL